MPLDPSQLRIRVLEDDQGQTEEDLLLQQIQNDADDTRKLAIEGGLLSDGVTEVESVVQLRDQARVFGVGARETWPTAAGVEVEQTLGGSTDPVTITAVADGLEVALSPSNRLFALSTPYVLPQIGRHRLRLELTPSDVGGTPAFGLALGASGGSRRLFYYRANGQVLSYLDDESITEIQSVDPAWEYTSVSSVAIEVEVAASIATDATLTIERDGTRRSFALDLGAPFDVDGDVPVWVAVRAAGEATLHALTVEAMSSYVNDQIAALENVSGEFASLDTRLTALETLLAGLAVPVPAGFDYAPSFGVYRTGGGGFTTDLSPLALRPFAAEAATSVLYVDVATGDDSNAGTEASPFRSIYKAVHGQSGDVVVYVMPGTYAGNDSWRDANPTMDRLMVLRWPGADGRIVSSRHQDGLVWTAAGVGVYTATPASVSSVVDAADLSPYGDYTRLTALALPGDVGTSPGSYHWGGGTLTVRLHDDRAPDSDIRVYADARNGLYQRAGGQLYVEHVDFEGGDRSFQVACLDVAASIVATFDSCSFKYSGSDYGSARNGLGTDGRVYSYCFDCIAAQNVADGFNYHSYDTSPGPIAVEVRCIGRSNGWNANDTNNGSTIHDAGRIVRVEGEYYDNQDRNVHDVGGSQSWCLGCASHDSRGDETGINWAAGTGASDGSAVWLDTCESEGSTYDLQTAAESVIYTRDLTSEGSDAPGTTSEAY